MEQNRSKLVSMFVRNIGCIGNEGVTIALDDIVCLVGRNNAGKSTILRAYELAKKSVSFDPSRDRCQWAPEGEPSEIQLDVHIPAGIGNVDPKWKRVDGNLQIVKSRWIWAAPDYKYTRSTWSPEESDWADDMKAGGADGVFNSRLPRPIRIGSLDDAEKTEAALMTIALAPLIAAIEHERKSEGSKLVAAVKAVSTIFTELGSDHADHFNLISTNVSTGFNAVFPNLAVRLLVEPGSILPTKLADIVKGTSGLVINDGGAETSVGQQGTGARRALFWSMLQVHNEFLREQELKAGPKKTAKKKSPVKATAEVAPDEVSTEDADDPALPGYLLLIDEPENALHPMAARAAQRHLYSLAQNPDWQVMMTTHSPYFVNALEDHTTIVRLERSQPAAGASVTQRIYRSDDMNFKFDADDKARLQALQHIDPSFSEIFFGSYPVIVEGDTEHGAFMAAITEKQHPLGERITIIRARGKPILVPLIKILAHFRIDFGIVHDCDPPFTKNGDKNGMWTENAKIHSEISNARSQGVTVRHRTSIPDFERFLGRDEASKDKPVAAYLAVKNDEDLGKAVCDLMTELCEGKQHQPMSDEEIAASDYNTILLSKVTAWAAKNNEAANPRFSGIVISLLQ